MQHVKISWWACVTESFFLFLFFMSKMSLLKSLKMSYEDWNEQWHESWHCSFPTIICHPIIQIPKRKKNLQVARHQPKWKIQILKTKKNSIIETISTELPFFISSSRKCRKTEANTEKNSSKSSNKYHHPSIRIVVPHSFQVGPEISPANPQAWATIKKKIPTTVL